MAPIRVVIHHRDTPDGDAARVARAKAMRSEPGCLQAEDFRSLENADHMLHLELWEDAAAWDRHWTALKASPEGPAIVEAMRALQAPYHPGGPDHPRKLGNDAELSLLRLPADRAADNSPTGDYRQLNWRDVQALAQAEAVGFSHSVDSVHLIFTSAVPAVASVP